MQPRWWFEQAAFRVSIREKCRDCDGSKKKSALENSQKMQGEAWGGNRHEAGFPAYKNIHRAGIANPAKPVGGGVAYSSLCPAKPYFAGISKTPSATDIKS
jgi:hypothetical protein